MGGPRGTVTRLRLGIFIAVCGLVTFVGLFIHSQSKRLFVPKLEIRADFRTTTGLRKGSMVQLAGVEIGNVSRIDFVQKRYECDPLTEDVGRFGQGRTDDCDDFLFCAPVGLCGDLEPWAGRGEHAQCNSTEDCREDEICVTTEFRRREPRVLWSGIHGVCARYNTEHIRVQVKMTIEADKVAVIRTDSRASVASNSVLGDQLVNITTGHGDPLSGDFRLQASPSMTEDIERFRARIVNFLDAADISLTAIKNVIDELRDEQTISDIKGIVDHLELVTEHIAEQRGVIGALIGSPQYRDDFGATLRSIRKTAEGLEVTVQRANSILATIDRSFEPLVEDAAAGAEQQWIVTEDVGIALILTLDALSPETRAALRRTDARTQGVQAISALSGEGLDDLLAAIEARLAEALDEPRREAELVLPHSDGRRRAWLHEQGVVVAEEVERGGGGQQLGVRGGLEREIGILGVQMLTGLEIDHHDALRGPADRRHGELSVEAGV